MQLPPTYTFQKRLHGGGEGVSLLAKDGDNKDVVLKMPSEMDGVWAEGKLSEQARSNFEAAKRREQEAAEALPDTFISGRLENLGEQIFWVRPHWPRCLRDSVAFKEVPTAKQLSSMFLGIVRGLAALARLDGGAHGNLNLNNILLGDQRHPEVRLVDPLDASAAEPKADKRALGLVLYQLVRAEFIGMDRSMNSVSADEDWGKVLGRLGDEWKELCSDLLNPYSPLAEEDWSAVEERILRINSGGTGGGKWIVFAVLLAGGFGAGLFFFWQGREETVTVDESTLEAQWSSVLDQYFDWARAFLASRRDFERSGRPEAKVFVGQFETKGPFDGGDLSKFLLEVVPEARALFSSAPEEAEQLAREVEVLALNQSAQKDIVRAERFLKELRDNLESWPVVAALRESRSRFETDGFTFGVTRMDRLLQSFDFQGSELTYEILFKFQKSAQEVDNLQRAYRRFDSELEQLKSLSSMQFSTAYVQQARGGLGELGTEAVGYLNSEAARAQRVREAWERDSGDVSTALFQQAEADFLESADLGNATVVDRWINLLRDHTVMDRQVLEEDLSQLQKESESLIADIFETEEQLEVKEAMATKLSGRYEQILASYKANEPEVWIESERMGAMENIGKTESALSGLISDLELRLAELKIDRPRELAAMRTDSLGLETELLAAEWNAFRERVLEGKTAASFADDREFIDFRRRYKNQRARLEHFESSVLTELRKLRIPELDSLSGDVRKAGNTMWTTIYAGREKAFIEAAADTLFDARDPMVRTMAELNETQEELKRTAEDLEDYLVGVEKALLGYQQWDLPEAGLADWFGELNRTSQRLAWSSGPLMADLLEPLRRIISMQDADAATLVDLAAGAEEADSFFRFLALSRIAGLGRIPVLALNRLQVPVEGLEGVIPERLEAEWIALRKELWGAGYVAAQSPEERAECIRMSSIYGVLATDLSGSERFAFELFDTIELLEKEAATYEARPQMLEEIRNSFQTLPNEDDGEARSTLIRDLSEVDVEFDAASMEEAPFEREGWQIIEDGEDRKVLEWSGNRETFHRMSGETGDFFVAQTEMSINLFIDWMSEGDRWSGMQDQIPPEWSAFVESAYDPGPGGDHRRGPRLWNPGRSGLIRSGARKPLSWFGGFDSFYEEMFSNQGGDVLAPASALSFDLPMQHTGAELARSVAESMGMRLPLPSEWKRVAGEVNTATDTMRLWNEAWSDGFEANLLAEIRMDSFYDANSIPQSGGGNGEAPLFQPVRQGGSRMKHLVGNVAEFVYDQNAGKYYVAGGSALAEVAGTWEQLHPVSTSNESYSFSDVGLRLYFDAPLESPRVQILDILKKTWQDL